jgi:type II secretory pathway pseudopilin PulG
MDPTEARRQSGQPFSRRSAARTNVNEYEARSREVQRKIEYLRQLRSAVQERQLRASTPPTSDGFLTAAPRIPTKR